MQTRISSKAGQRQFLRSRVILSALVVGCMVPAAPQAEAAVAYWTGVGGSSWGGDGGTQNWSSTAASPGAPYTPVNNDDLRWFSLSTSNKASTNDLTGLLVRNISFQGAPAGIVLSGNTLTVTGTIGSTSGGAAGTINLPLELDAATVVIGGVTGDTITVNGTISETGGSRGVRFNAGTIALTGNNSFSGNVQLGFTTAAPTVTINSLASVGTNQSLGSGSLVAFGFRTFDATLVYTGGATSTNKGFAIGENSSVGTDKNGGGTFVNNGSGAVTWSGAQTLLAQPSTLTRTFGLGGSNAGDNDWQSAIGNNTGGLVAFTKTGAGKWILSGNNTYDGATTVSAGTLLVNGDQSGALGAVSVAAGAILGGTGTIGGVSAAVSGTVAPGLSEALGTLSFANTAVDFATDGSLLAGLDASFSSDVLAISGTGSLTLGGTSTLDLTGPASFASAGTYTVATFPSGSRTGEFTTVTYNGTTYANPTTTNAVNSGGTLVYNADSIQLLVVPEPRTLALVVVGMSLAGVLARRRRACR